MLAKGATGKQFFTGDPAPMRILLVEKQTAEWRFYIFNNLRLDFTNIYQIITDINPRGYYLGNACEYQVWNVSLNDGQRF